MYNPNESPAGKSRESIIVRAGARLAGLKMKAERVMALAGLAATLWCAPAFGQSGTCALTDNGVSQFPVVIDGIFTLPQEWSDITPQTYFVDANGTLFLTCPGDHTANSFVYACLDDGLDAVYLMYDFVAMTVNPSGFPGTTVAQVQFAVHLPAGLGGNPPDQNTPITVRFVVGGAHTPPDATSGGNGQGNSAVFVVFDVNVPGGSSNVLGGAIGLEGAGTFGPSPNSPTPHLLAELAVPLRIPPNFGGVFPGNGINPATGAYDPDPKFWGSGFTTPTGPTGTGGQADPPASANILQIHPNGHVTSDSSFVPPVGSQPDKAAVLDDLVALLQTTTDRKTAQELSDAIQSMIDALDPKLWLNTTHLKSNGGQKVFDAEQKTVQELSEISKKTPSLAATLQPWIARLVAVDRSLAQTAISDAAANPKNAKKVGKANQQVAEGDHDALGGQPAKAIQDYEDAWKSVQ